MFRILWSVGCLSAALVLNAAGSVAEKLPADARKSAFHGFDRYDFTLDGVRGTLVVPVRAAAGNPWIWRARFFGHQPQTDVALLKNGFHLAYTDVANLYGSPGAVARWDRGYEFLTGRLNLSRKPVLEGMSRGGLIIFNWAKKNPDKVAAIYADAPVCDFQSWPGGKGKGIGSAGDYAACLRAYGLSEAQAATCDGQPKDRLDRLAGAGVPVLAVCGQTDRVVPMAENIDVLAENYRRAGGKIRIIGKPGNGHHPHSLKDPSVIVNFLRGAAVGENDFLRPRDGLANCLRKFRNEKTGTVAFIGGSITEMNGYTKLTERHLRTLFPDCEFKFINAGISSTCSDTGAFRLDRDVFEHGKPDLLFVEFAVNDNQDGHLAPERSIRAMEGIVRNARAHNPKMDLVFLYTANESHLKNYGANARPLAADMVDKKLTACDNTRGPARIPAEIAAHEQVAAHYGIPSVNFAADVEERMRHGEFDWKTFGGVHPAPFGAEIYGDDILALLRGQLAKCDFADKSEPAALPAPLDAANFADGRLIAPGDARIKSGWRCGVPDWSKVEGGKRERFLKCVTLYADTPGAEFSLPFTGTAIGLYLTAGADAGKVEYRIDGGEWKTRDLFHAYSSALHYPYTAMLAENLAPGTHTLTLRVAAEKNPHSKGTAVRIMGFAAN